MQKDVFAILLDWLNQVDISSFQESIWTFEQSVHVIYAGDPSWI